MPPTTTATPGQQSGTSGRKKRKGRKGGCSSSYWSWPS